MVRFYILILFSVSVSSLIYSQNFQQKFGGIPVTINSISAANPFNGGMDNPRIHMLDIDNDGDLDLFVYDRDTSLNFYRNDGTISAPSFKLINLRFNNLPIKNWYYFVDIDSDNDFDLFTGGDLQTVRYFKNTGNPSNPNFVLTINELKTDTDSTIISESVCIPTFADIDADGDLDFFTGSSIGRVTFYENVGTPQIFIFRFITGYYKNIEIIGGAIDNERHGASSIYFTDIDADNDSDLFWGDYFQPSIYFIKNIGTPQNFNWNLIDSTYPHPSPWFSLGYNMPRFYDIDNDGKKDLFSGVLYSAQTKNSFVYYKNNGPANNPSFTKITENYIPSIEVGSNSFPALTDIDNDGDYDLFIGSSSSTISYYKNTGSLSSPAFELVSDSLPVLHTSFNYAPSFGDLDNDGKKDLLLGSFDGKFRFLKNTGSLSGPVFTLQSSQVDTIDVGQSSAPAPVDIDNDGDLDLFSGNWNGRTSYYRNDGNASAFNFTYVTNFYLSIDVGDESNLSFIDIDNDGDKDMFIGRRDGKISYYKNTGTTASPNFVLQTDSYAIIRVGSNSVPAFVDIDADTDKDLFVGNIKGGLFYFENRDVIGIKPLSNEIPTQFKLYQNYPNPFNPITKITFSIPPSRGARGVTVQLVVYDILGREIASLIPPLRGGEEGLHPGIYEISWDASNYTSGVYFYRLDAGGFSETKRMVLIK
jgi:hypothetical protein